MLRSRIATPFAASFMAIALSCVSACNSDSSAGKKDDAPKVKEAIPQDLVVNDFLQEKGAKAKPLVDAAAGALAANDDTSSSSTGDGGAGGSGGDDTSAGVTERKITLIDPGAEPRSPKRYAFKTQTEVRKVSMLVKSTRESQGQKQDDSQPAMIINLVFTLKGTKNGVYHYDALLKNVDVDLPPNMDKKTAAQAKAAIASFSGIHAGIDVTARGSVGEVQFEADKLPRGAAQQILPLFSQVFEFVVAPFPEEAIGLNAKWQETTEGAADGVKSKVVAIYTLKEWNADGGVVEAQTTRSAPRQPVPDPRMQGATIRLEGKGTHHFEVKVAGLAQRALGENASVLTLDAPGPSGKAEQALVETTLVKDLLETPPAH